MYGVAHQDGIGAREYKVLMMDQIDDMPENGLNALREIEKEKL
jgi:hypothetical protein